MKDVNQLSTAKKQAEFLSAYKAVLRISTAAERVEMDRQNHYNWLRDDPDYRAQFEAAQEDVINRSRTKRLSGLRWAGRIRYRSSCSRAPSLTSTATRAPGAYRPRGIRADPDQGGDCDCPDPPQATGMTGSQEMQLHPERGHRATVESGNRKVRPNFPIIEFYIKA
jgi:hypothetical protein